MTTTDLDWAAAPDEYYESRGLLVIDWPERPESDYDEPEWAAVHDFGADPFDLGEEVDW